MKPKVVIIGAGGHAKIVCDLILKLNKHEIIGFADISVNESMSRKTDSIFYLNYKIIANQESLTKLFDQCDHFIIALGNNKKRAHYYDQMKHQLIPLCLIHPNANVSSTAIIGQGSVILANAVVNSNSIVAENCILNSGVIVDNDCRVDDHVYLKMGTLVGNNSMVHSFYTSVMGQIISPFSILETNV
jgi:UDP-3-O-[3-hydroxymyristoyl] glucosamine N-acyltransferase